MKIYVPVPTARGYVLAFFALASFCIAMVNANPSTSLVAALFIGGVLSGYVFAISSVSGFEMEREGSREGVCGSQVELPLVLRNLTCRPRQSLVVRESLGFGAGRWTDHVVGPLGCREERTLVRHVPARKRGSYSLGRVWLVGGDSMGFFKVWRKFDLPGEIVIYPMTARISQLPLEHHHNMKVLHNGRALGISGQGQEIFGLREYRTGDAWRLINWRASAKRRKMVVKEFEAQSVSSVLILLDTDVVKAGDDLLESNFEYNVSLAASLVKYLSGVYCNVTFVCGSGKSACIYESGTAYSVCARILSILTDIRPVETTLGEVIESHSSLFTPQTLIYFLVMDYGESEYRMLSELVDRGVEIRLIKAPRRLFPREATGFRPKLQVVDTGSVCGGLMEQVVYSGLDMEGVF